MVQEYSKPERDVYEFILEKIDSVPHLEALVLLWNSRPVGWTCEDLATRLYVPLDEVRKLLCDLVRHRLVAKQATTPARYAYLPGPTAQDETIQQVEEAYRKDLVGISTMIHSKASSAVREFARAFRVKKEPEDK